MPGLLGINTSGDGTADTAELAGAGARWVRFPDTPELLGMLNGYAAKGLPVWCTEYDSRTMGMGAYLITQAERAAVMCWSDQTQEEPIELALQRDLDRMNDFRIAAGRDPIA